MLPSHSCSHQTSVFVAYVAGIISELLDTFIPSVFWACLTTKHWLKKKITLALFMHV